jgi:hypothetical protein
MHNILKGPDLRHADVVAWGALNLRKMKPVYALPLTGVAQSEDIRSVISNVRQGVMVDIPASRSQASPQRTIETRSRPKARNGRPDDEMVE